MREYQLELLAPQSFVPLSECHCGMWLNSSRRKCTVEKSQTNVNQSDYASSQAGNLKRHLKIHSGEKTKQMQSM